MASAFHVYFGPEALDRAAAEACAESALRTASRR